jgi:hypothetical protein
MTLEQCCTAHSRYTQASADPSARVCPPADPAKDPTNNMVSDSILSEDTLRNSGKQVLGRQRLCLLALCREEIFSNLDVVRILLADQDYKKHLH